MNHLRVRKICGTKTRQQLLKAHPDDRLKITQANLSVLQMTLTRGYRAEELKQATRTLPLPAKSYDLVQEGYWPRTGHRLCNINHRLVFPLPLKSASTCTFEGA